MPSYLEVQQEAQRLLQLRPLFMECKPSGDWEGAEIVEMAIIDTDGQELLDALVGPKGAVRPEAEEMYGITEFVAKTAPPWSEVWPVAEKLLRGRNVGVFGLEQTLRWMRESHQQRFLRWDLETEAYFCIQKLHALYQGEPDSQTGTYRLFSLPEAAVLVGLDAEPVHSRRALDDARLARRILGAMAGWKVDNKY
jgi:DNA polymerase-3 subunit epsilon